MWSKYSLQDYVLGGALLAAALCVRYALFRFLDIRTRAQRPRFLYNYWAVWKPLGLLIVIVAVAPYVYIAEGLHAELLAAAYAVVVGIPVFVLLSCDSLGEALDIWDALNARIRQRL